MNESEEQSSQHSIPSAPIPIPASVRARQFRSTVLPVVVFAISFVTMVVIWNDFIYHNPIGFEGRVTATKVEIKSPMAGHVRDVYVKPFQKVRAGDLLVLVSKEAPDFSEASIALLKAEMELFKAEQSDKLNEGILRYQRLRLELLENKTTLASKTVELGQAIRNYNRLIDLDDISSQQANEDAKTEMEALQAEVESLNGMIGSIEKSLNVLSESYAGSNNSDDNILGSFEASFMLAEARLKLLETQQGPIEIKAPINGLITRFESVPGYHVQAGEPLLTIESDVPNSIVAYIPEPIAKMPEVGDELFITAPPHQPKHKTQILSVGAQVTQIPDEFRNIPSSSQPEFGLPVRVAVPSELAKIIAGQKVHLKF